jgi:hypothetical protein
MPIESEVYGSPVGRDGSRRETLRPFPEGARAQILEQARDRLVLLLPAGPSRVSRSGGIGLLAMNGTFIGGMAWWTSQAIGVAQNAFIIACMAVCTIFLAAFSSVILVIWLRLRFLETWILVEPGRIAVKNTLFGRSVLKTYDVEPDTVATFVSSQMAGDNSTPGFNIRIRCGRKKIVFGTVLGLDEKQWILDEINRIVSGGDPLLASVILRDGKFEFVPDDVTPEQAGGNVRIDQSDAGILAVEATAKPRTALRRAGVMLTFVLSGLVSLWLLGNLFMSWWPRGMPLLIRTAFTAVALLFVGIFLWGHAAILFVTTKITIDRERLARSRTGAVFGRPKSIPTSSVTQVVVRTRDDPRGRRDGKSYRRLPDRGGAECLARTASGSLELSLLHETKDVLQIAGLVRFQLRRFEQTSPE